MTTPCPSCAALVLAARRAQHTAEQMTARMLTAACHLEDKLDACRAENAHLEATVQKLRPVLWATTSNTNDTGDAA